MGVSRFVHLGAHLALLSVGVNQAFAVQGADPDACERGLRPRLEITTEFLGKRGIEIRRITTPEVKLKKTHPGMRIQELFGPEPQVIIGADSRGGHRPYLIVGDTRLEVLTTREEQRTRVVYNAALKMPQSQSYTATIYQLGTRRAEVVDAGYFVRLGGLSQERVRDLEGQVRRLAGFEREGEDWKGMTDHLRAGLENNGIELACEDTSCGSIVEMVKKIADHGIIDRQSREQIVPEYYLLDEPSLGHVYRVQKLQNLGMNLLIGVGMVAVVGTGVFLLALLYDVIAISHGWPRMPGLP